MSQWHNPREWTKEEIGGEERMGIRPLREFCQSPLFHEHSRIWLPMCSQAHSHHKLMAVLSACLWSQNSTESQALQCDSGCLGKERGCNLEVKTAKKRASSEASVLHLSLSHTLLTAFALLGTALGVVTSVRRELTLSVWWIKGWLKNDHKGQDIQEVRRYRRKNQLKIRLFLLLHSHNADHMWHQLYGVFYPLARYTLF